MGSGGPRRNAGRPRGSLGELTHRERIGYCRALAAFIREAKRSKEIKFKVPEDDIEAARTFIVRVLSKLALEGDSRAAIHLDEKCFGVAKIEVEQSVSPASAEVQHVHRIEFVDAPGAGADPPLETPPTASGPARVRRAVEKAGREGRRRGMGQARR